MTNFFGVCKHPNNEYSLQLEIDGELFAEHFDMSGVTGLKEALKARVDYVEDYGLPDQVAVRLFDLTHTRASSQTGEVHVHRRNEYLAVRFRNTCNGRWAEKRFSKHRFKSAVEFRDGVFHNFNTIAGEYNMLLLENLPHIYHMEKHDLRVVFEYHKRIDVSLWLEAIKRAKKEELAC